MTPKTLFNKLLYFIQDYRARNNHETPKLSFTASVVFVGRGREADAVGHGGTGGVQQYYQVCNLKHPKHLLENS